MRYANITSSLALFIALGGTGYAATQAAEELGPRQADRGGGGRELGGQEPLAQAGRLRRRCPRARRDRKGDTGAPGRDATQVVLADASDSSGTDVGIGAFNSIVDSHQLQTAITTAAPARIVAQAAITLTDTSANASPKDANCKISLDDRRPR